jgi:hypothetical protein
VTTADAFTFLFQEYNHFEIILIDKFDKNYPPPALALCTASPFDPPPISQFKQDYLRFWPQDEGIFFYTTILHAQTYNNGKRTNQSNGRNQAKRSNRLGHNLFRKRKARR